MPKIELLQIMYGAFDAWMSNALGGLSSVSNATSTAWQHVMVHPDPAAVAKLGYGAYVEPIVISR